MTTERFLILVFIGAVSSVLSIAISALFVGSLALLLLFQMALNFLTDSMPGLPALCVGFILCMGLGGFFLTGWTLGRRNRFGFPAWALGVLWPLGIVALHSLIRHDFIFSLITYATCLFGIASYWIGMQSKDSKAISPVGT